MRRLPVAISKQRNEPWCEACGNTRVIHRPRFGVDACPACAAAAEADWLEHISKTERRAA